MNALPVRIVIDTNILWTRDERRIFADGLAEVVARQPRINKRVFLAEITVKEVIYQKIKSAEAFRQKIEGAAKTLSSGRSILPFEIGWNSKIESTIGKLNKKILRGFKWKDATHAATSCVKKEIRKHRIRVLPTPISSISWESMIEDAVWRRAPFEGTPDSPAEKGFRDAIFVQTALFAAKKEPEAHWCILTSDGKIRERLESEKTKGNTPSDFDTFGSIPDFLGFTKLLVERFEANVAKALPLVASNVFYGYFEDEGLWTREGIEKQILQKFGSAIREEPKSRRSSSASPDPFAVGTGIPNPFSNSGIFLDDTWYREEEIKFYSDSTRFVERQGERTIWATRVLAYSYFRKGISVYMYSSDSPVLIRETAFDVVWSSDVDVMKITSAKMEKIDLTESRLLDGSFELCMQLGFPLVASSGPSAFLTRQYGTNVPTSVLFRTPLPSTTKEAR